MSRPIRLVSVILPTYNEAGNIVDLVKDIHAHIVQPHEILVVDDNSPDGTSRLIQELIHTGKVPGLRVETRTRDRGLRKSIQHGIDAAKGDLVVWLDCDFSMPPHVIPHLLHQIEQGCDIAVGSRFVKGGHYKKAKQWIGGEESKLAILLSRILNFALRYTLYPSFHDYTSGFIAIRAEVLRKIRLRGNYGEYFIDFMCRAIMLGYTYVEIPYVNVPRRAGESKTGASITHLFHTGWPYLFTIFRVWMLRLQKMVGGKNG